MVDQFIRISILDTILKGKIVNWENDAWETMESIMESWNAYFIDLPLFSDDLDTLSNCDLLKCRFLARDFETIFSIEFRYYWQLDSYCLRVRGESPDQYHKDSVKTFHSLEKNGLYLLEQMVKACSKQGAISVSGDTYRYRAIYDVVNETTHDQHKKMKHCFLVPAFATSA